MVSIILMVLWAACIYQDIFGLIKGYFIGEKKKVEKHEPAAYRKWIRISSVLLILCGALNIFWEICDLCAPDAGSFKYTILFIITLAVMIAAVSVAYVLIVKPADKKKGIESELEKEIKEILKEDKN